MTTAMRESYCYVMGLWQYTDRPQARDYPRHACRESSKRYHLHRKVATSPCHFLPLLPPITRNVRWLRAAKSLEFRIRAQTVHDTRPKSGKNGNVDCRNQLYRLGRKDGLGRRKIA